ncbi:MAG TPA: hypothetical protein VKR30_00470 [Candidatus Limnocylindrales bacterium]|nr:hypothetical protein [Candidatus Limnocylindrales bacterium]
MFRLMEELLEAMEQRDQADPDAPAWEAVARIRRLEEELTRRLAGVPSGQTFRVAVQERELVPTT